MKEILFLSRTFARQIVLRSVITSTGVVFTVGVFFLLTSPSDSWWFTNFPEIKATGSYVKHHNPWDFFIIVFVTTTLLSYARSVERVIVDRWNFGQLVAIARADLAQAEDPMEGMAARRSTLGARRRVLEGVLGFYPAMVQLFVVSIILMSEGLVFAGFTGVVILAGVAAGVPWMVRRFERRREDVRDHSPVEKRARTPDPHERAEQSIAETSARMKVLMSRPLEKMRVAGPLIVFAIAMGSLMAGLIIAGMYDAHELPVRSTLLIIFLVLTARSALEAVQKAEDLAFYATAVEQLNDGESGIELL